MTEHNPHDDKSVRLLSLVVLLSSTRRPITRAEVFDRMSAFYTGAGGARERMFERDKDDLRNIGFVIDTIDDAENDDLVGYRIDSRRTLESDVTFSADEAVAVSLAARLWEGSAAFESVGQAALGIEALAGQPLTTWFERVLRFAPLPEPVEPLTQALRTRTRVSFDYLKPGDASASTRRVEPWIVTTLAGRWYVVGQDINKAAMRKFRLDRIVGAVSRTSESNAYTIPEDLVLSDLLQGPGEATADATVLVRKGCCHQLRRDAVSTMHLDDDWDRCVLSPKNEQRLARLIAGFGADARVESPDSLQQRVRLILTAALGDGYAR